MLHRLWTTPWWTANGAIHQIIVRNISSPYWLKWAYVSHSTHSVRRIFILISMHLYLNSTVLLISVIIIIRISPEFITAADNPRRSSWTLEKGYNGSDKEYPFSVVGAGVKAGLTTLLRVYEKDMEYMCRGPLQGFQVLLHTPGEVPQLSKHFFHVPLSRKVFVSIKPNLITISDSLRHYKPKRRKCYFNSERLRFFKVYTQRNCELECLSNITKAMCGCVKFSMPSNCQGKSFYLLNHLNNNHRFPAPIRSLQY